MFGKEPFYFTRGITVTRKHPESQYKINTYKNDTDTIIFVNCPTLKSFIHWFHTAVLMGGWHAFGKAMAM